MTAARGANAARDVKAPTTQRADVGQTVEIIRALLDIGHAAEAVVADVLTEFELTASVAGVLWAVAPPAQPPTLREVAARLHCDPSTISLSVDKLENLGFVARQPHPTDGRKRTLALTDRGQRLWEALSTRLHTSGVLASLDTREQHTLHALLAKL